MFSNEVKYFLCKQYKIEHSAGQNSSITCSYKANSGILYPLPRAFMYVVKPPIHIRFDEIAYVNFARGSVSVNKNFDFEVRLYVVLGKYLKLIIFV